MERSSLTDRRLAALCAEAARDAVVEYERHFDEITRRARDRFLARDWRGSFDDSRERLRLYSLILDSLTNRTRELMADRLDHRSIWKATKAAYSALIAKSDRWEIAESFFNSLTRRIFATEGVNQAIEFVDTDFDASASDQHKIARTYSGGTLTRLVIELLTDEGVGGFALEYWRHLRESVELAAKRLDTALPGAATIETVTAVFYRGRGAYVVGRAMRGDASIAIAFSLFHPEEGGITLDALLIGEADLAILFSFTRAYFRV